MKRFLLAALCALASFFVHADDDLKGLCAQDIEGSYVGTFGADGHKVRINLICLESDRLVATLTPTDGDKHIPNSANAHAVNMTFTAIDGNELITSDFPLNHEGRKTHSTKGMISYLRMDLTMLHNHQIHGLYMRYSLLGFKQVNAVREQIFPKAVPVAKPGLIAKSSLTGVYAVGHSRLGPAHIIADVLGEVPVIYFRPRDTADPIRMIDGPTWDGTGAFSVATAGGNGGEPDDLKLFHMRGTLVNDREIDFYLISPGYGIEGPLRAFRIAVFQGDIHSPGSYAGMASANL